jgi:dihydroorotase
MRGRYSLLIRGGRVIDPAAGIDGPMDVLLRDGRVAQVAEPDGTRGTADEIINASGLIVAPGFIDLHVHLRQPGQSHKETIATGTAAAAAGGFTSVCAMPNTVPVNDTPDITAWMQHPERKAVTNVFPIAAATVGSRGEFLTDYAALRRAGAVGVSDDGRPVLDTNVMRNALIAAKAEGIPVIQHAEDTRLSHGGAMNAGANALRLGLRGISAESEYSIIDRDCTLARDTGAHLHVAHISTAGGVRAVRKAKAAGIDVTCEVAPHHFTLTDAEIGEYDTHYKMNPPLRSEADRAAILAGIADGTIDCIATDHAPHAYHEKEVEFDRAAFGITGLETALPLALAVLHRERKLPLSKIVALLSANPARVIGKHGIGTLGKGAHADVVIFDPKKRWTFDAKHSLSRSKNTPFDGWQFTGRVVTTIVNGKIAYQQ